MRWLVSMVILLPLLVGDTPQRAEPNYPRLEDSPFPADLNLVVGKLLAYVRAELGQPMTHTRTWYDVVSRGQRLAPRGCGGPPQ
jgi:hypothetical protein